MRRIVHHFANWRPIVSKRIDAPYRSGPARSRPNKIAHNVNVRAEAQWGQIEIAAGTRRPIATYVLNDELLAKEQVGPQFTPCARDKKELQRS